jgi:tetratricopeptide (TPR) repeat protein
MLVAQCQMYFHKYKVAEKKLKKVIQRIQLVPKVETIICFIERYPGVPLCSFLISPTSLIDIKIDMLDCIANCRKKMGDFDQASRYLKEALEIRRVVQSHQAVTSNLINLAVTYNNAGRKEESHEALEEIMKRITDKGSMSSNIWQCLQKYKYAEDLDLFQDLMDQHLKIHLFTARIRKNHGRGRQEIVLTKFTVNFKAVCNSVRMSKKLAQSAKSLRSSSFMFS